MKKSIFAILAILSLTLFASAQSKSNDAISTQIKALRADKTFTLSYDESGKTSKLMVVAENFSDHEAHEVGIQAMNFAIGFFYPGKELSNAPDPIMLTFWVLTKKPRFSQDHSLMITLGDENLVIGQARYVAKPRENMEYLNFQITREQLDKIAMQSDVKFRLGSEEFTFIKEHLRDFANLLIISDPKQ
jgi:hypothetical protein